MKLTLSGRGFHAWTAFAALIFFAAAPSLCSAVQNKRDRPEPSQRDIRGPGESNGRDGFRGPGTFRGRDDSRGPGGSGPPRYDGPTEAKVNDKGFLFIDGQYIPPPYEIHCDGSKLTVNGHELTCHPPPRESIGRGFGSRGGGDTSLRYWVGSLHGQLAMDYVVMSFSDQPNVVFDATASYDLLKSFHALGGRSIRQVTVRDQLPIEFDKNVWNEWIEKFVAPDELKSRAAALANNYEETQLQALHDIRSHRLLEKMAYPLSVSSMVMSVLAIGHLLGGRPHAGKPTYGMDPSPEMILALNWSIAFTVAFSLLDLVWTILATNANGVSELNPIGNQLLHDPRNLAGFKLSVTFSCLALLWLLRKYKRAQIAAWWLCLVLTLVTCRWVLVNTMMASAQ